MANTITGTLTVAEGVLADLAGYAALESYGIVGMTSPTISDGIAKLLPANRMRKGVVVSLVQDNVVKVDLYVITEHGVNIAEVSRMLSERVEYVLTTYAQMNVESVNVHVQGVKVRD